MHTYEVNISKNGHGMYTYGVNISKNGHGMYTYGVNISKNGHGMYSYGVNILKNGHGMYTYEVSFLKNCHCIQNNDDFVLLYNSLIFFNLNDFLAESRMSNALAANTLFYSLRKSISQMARYVLCAEADV